MTGRRSRRTELGSDARAMVHSGRSPAKCETSDKAIVGQGNKRCAYSHERVIVASLSVLTVAAAPLPRGKQRKFVRNDIREDGRGSKRRAGDEGMGPRAESTEGQGSHNTAKYFGSHGLEGSPHDCHTSHRAATYSLGNRGSFPKLRVQNHVYRVNPKCPLLTTT